ncbi:hypothetical protein [Halomontanus rarus]|uniref:hypothetical protein n=1 Tax=Halomontanus rarus TaxID=3034020 RepID=UPI0023E8BD0F|nr:hypothetical protein [Halovivax sp. TS33]
MKDTEPDEPNESTHDHTATETGSETPSATSRRTVLAAVGAGMVASSGVFATGASGAESVPTTDRRYLECSRPTINHGAFPEAVQAEFDEALESGRYESDRPPRVLETMDIEESHVRIDGTVYTPVVDETGEGAYVLTLEEESNPTLSEPRTLDIRNRSAESRTLTVRVEAPGGNEAQDEESEPEVLYDGPVEIDAGEERTVWGTNVIGTYDLRIETEDGEHVEDGFYVTEGGFTSVEIGEDGDVGVAQAVAGLARCEFDPEAYSSPWVELELGVESESEHLELGERTTAELLLTYTTEGVSEYDLEVTVDDTDVLRIADVQYDEAFDAGDTPEIAADGSAATLRAVDTTAAVPSATRFIPLASVELEATDEMAAVDDGEELTTRVAVTVESVIDDDGSTVDASGDTDPVTVARSPEWGTGIDRYAYSRDSRGVVQRERDAPLVTIGNDAVVVHGSSTMGPSACSGEELVELAVDDADGALAATVSGPNDPDYEFGACTDDVAAVSYELIATLEEDPVETVRLTERAYARSGTSVVARDDARPAVRGVDDYEFSLVDREVETAEDADHDPEVTLEGGTVVVAGTIELSTIGCETLEPALIAYDETWGRLVVEVTDTRLEMDPGETCPAAAGFQGYELRVPIGTDVESLRRVSAVEPTVDGTRLVSVDGHELEPGEGIELNGHTPQDLNGDGLYRDVDGNGELGTNDVVTLFDHLEHEAVTENPEAFDFAGTGEVTTTDVVELFERL